MNTILAVGRILNGEIHMRISPLLAVDDAAVDALLDEVYGKPGLGVEDSAATFDLFDYEGEAQDLEDDMADRDFWSKGQW